MNNSQQGMSNQKFVHRCNYCNESFENIRQYIEHLQTHENLINLQEAKKEKKSFFSFLNKDKKEVPLPPPIIEPVENPRNVPQGRLEKSPPLQTFQERESKIHSKIISLEMDVAKNMDFMMKLQRDLAKVSIASIKMQTDVKKILLSLERKEEPKAEAQKVLTEDERIEKTAQGLAAVAIATGTPKAPFDKTMEMVKKEEPKKEPEVKTEPVVAEPEKIVQPEPEEKSEEEEKEEEPEEESGEEGVVNFDTDMPFLYIYGDSKKMKDIKKALKGITGIKLQTS